jgi:hypothetical protein
VKLFVNNNQVTEFISNPKFTLTGLANSTQQLSYFAIDKNGNKSSLMEININNTKPANISTFKCGNAYFDYDNTVMQIGNSGISAQFAKVLRDQVNDYIKGIENGKKCFDKNNSNAYEQAVFKRVGTLVTNSESYFGGSYGFVVHNFGKIQNKGNPNIQFKQESKELINNNGIKGLLIKTIPEGEPAGMDYYSNLKWEYIFEINGEDYSLSTSYDINDIGNPNPSQSFITLINGIH